VGKKKNKKPYSKRSDIEKIKSNWKKITGLLNRKEWSSVVVRAATVVEIATNLVVRHELEINRGIEGSFVSYLMIWANGIQGKYQNLIIPSTKERKFHEEFKNLQSRISDINRERNSVVHQGQFKKKSTALRVVSETREIVNILVSKYCNGFELEEIDRK
tara:strand:+ start:32561 stop:33040 length:480 start_codon:yes stop_codon:yes gene_type:complete